MKNYAVGLKFEIVLTVDAEDMDDAILAAMSDEEYIGMLLAKAEPQVSFAERTDI